MISVRCENEDEICRRIENLIQMQQLEAAVGRACVFVQDIAKLGAHINTGELREKILVDTCRKGSEVFGIVYTNVPQAIYQEFGTGPEGASNHAGISPNASPSYTMVEWWVHESRVLESDAEMYHWASIETKDGKFYRLDGQAADPFLYPALKNNEDKIVDMLAESIKKSIGDNLG